MVPKPHKQADDLIDGSYFVVDDAEQKVYSCRAPEGSPRTGEEIGPEPVTCDAWAAPASASGQPSERDTRMRDMVAAWEARQRAREG